VAAFRSVIRDVTEREIASWRPGMRIVLRERMRALTFEVICRAVFGVTEPDRVARLRAALLGVVDLVNSNPLYVVWPLMRADLGPVSPGHWWSKRLARADQLLIEEIGRRRTEPDLEDRTDVLSLLLRARDEDGQSMTDVELRDELFTMLGAGHETTATGLAFAFELLLRNPATLSRLRDELANGAGDEYLDAVVKEALRVRPVIDAAERTLTRTRTVAGWELPAGIRVYPGIALVHMREDLYPRAREFRPERFIDEQADSYSWLPFGGGIRRCIGAALAQAEMAEVLRIAAPAVELRLRRDEPEPVLLRGITLAPKHGVEVEVAAVGRKSARAPVPGPADATANVQAGSVVLAEEP
jgi:cytochrome P450